MVKKNVGGAKENNIDIGGAAINHTHNQVGLQAAAWQPVERERVLWPTAWPTGENRAALGAASRCNPKVGGASSPLQVAFGFIFFGCCLLNQGLFVACLAKCLVDVMLPSGCRHNYVVALRLLPLVLLLLELSLAPS